LIIQSPAGTTSHANLIILLIVNVLLTQTKCPVDRLFNIKGENESWGIKGESTMPEQRHLRRASYGS
jgi:hypothetical protein